MGLFQANLANIRVLKESMSDFKTEQIANFTLALTTAFELLADYRESKLGKCFVFNFQKNGCVPINLIIEQVFPDCKQLKS